MDGLSGLSASGDPLDDSLGLSDPGTPTGIAVLGTFGVTDNQVSDQQLFTA
jgi:hypothetical protein